MCVCVCETSGSGSSIERIEHAFLWRQILDTPHYMCFKLQSTQADNTPSRSHSVMQRVNYSSHTPCYYYNIELYTRSVYILYGMIITLSLFALMNCLLQ